MGNVHPKVCYSYTITNKLPYVSASDVCSGGVSHLLHPLTIFHLQAQHVKREQPLVLGAGCVASEGWSGRGLYEQKIL